MRVRYGATLFLLLIAPAQAYEIETGGGIICDTQEQSERVASVLDGNEQVALNAVNAEERDATDCAVVTVVYVRGATLATARKIRCVRNCRDS